MYLNCMCLWTHKNTHCVVTVLELTKYTFLKSATNTPYKSLYLKGLLKILALPSHEYLFQSEETLHCDPGCRSGRFVLGPWYSDRWYGRDDQSLISQVWSYRFRIQSAENKRKNKIPIVVVFYIKWVLWRPICRYSKICKWKKALKTISKKI